MLISSFVYFEDTKFLVQVGKGTKGSYKTKYSFTGNLSKALKYYSCINIGNGYKKRLLMVDSCKQQVLEKCAS